VWDGRTRGLPKWRTDPSVVDFGKRIGPIPCRSGGPTRSVVEIGKNSLLKSGTDGPVVDFGKSAPP
jgi:hypothetical protein